MFFICVPVYGFVDPPPPRVEVLVFIAASLGSLGLSGYLRAGVDDEPLGTGRDPPATRGGPTQDGLQQAFILAAATVIRSAQRLTAANNHLLKKKTFVRHVTSQTIQLNWTHCCGVSVAEDGEAPTMSEIGRGLELVVCDAGWHYHCSGVCTTNLGQTTSSWCTILEYNIEMSSLLKTLKSLLTYEILQSESDE